MPQEIQEMEETQAVPAPSAGAEELIENLTKAWQEQEDATSINGSVVRTSTINLVIFSADAGAARDAEAVMPQLSDDHPCRAVHIVALPKADAPLQASSHTHTKVENGVRVISCEQVTLQAGFDTLQMLEGLIAPLLSPDLPACLWWRGNPPFDGKVFDALVAAADRVIYDSQYFLESEEDLPWAVDMIKRSEPYEVSFTDVNWARLTPWRSLTAQFFDGAQQMQALDGIDRVVIEYVDREVTANRVSTQAWLALGWLATRLRWHARGTATLATEGTTRFKLYRDDVSIDIVLQRRAADASTPDGLVALELHSTLPKAGTYRIELVTGQKFAKTTTTLEGVPPLERVVDMEPASYANLISNELDMPGRDRMYEEALTFSAKLQSPVEEVVSPS